MGNSRLKVLIAGNHTCGNRGDAAILRGLLNGLQNTHKDVEVDILSRFPESSSFLLGKPVRADSLNKYRLRGSRSLSDKLVNTGINKFLSSILAGKVAESMTYQHVPLPEAYQNYVDELAQYDAVIHVGGSFFVDSYGESQFDNALCCLLANKPLLILGHSVGPFGSGRFKEISELVFNRCKFLGLREAVSQRLVDKHLKISSPVTMGTDTAWLVDRNGPQIALPNINGDRPRIAITVRALTPFDKKLNIDQQEYEQAFAHLCSNLIDRGYGIVAASTCTGIDGYAKDDRIVALRIKKLCSPDHQQYFSVLTDEYNDQELGSILSKCELTIGTRLHSAIISMNFGTPAIALNYEHKSEGIMDGLNLPKLAMSLESLLQGEVLDRALECLHDLPALNRQVAVQVAEERKKTQAFIDKAIEALK